MYLEHLFNNGLNEFGHHYFRVIKNFNYLVVHLQRYGLFVVIIVVVVIVVVLYFLFYLPSCTVSPHGRIGHLQFEIAATEV